MNSKEEELSRQEEFEALLKKLPYYQVQGLQQGNDLDGWPIYASRVRALGLDKFLNKELGVAAFDDLHGMYYLYLRKQ